MPIDVVQWRARIGLFHSEGAYREMKRRCGCKHQKIKIRSLVGDSSFVVAVALLALELVRALARIVLQLQWKFLCHTSRCGYSNGKPSLSRKSISRANPGLITDLLSLSAVCLVILHSVVRMLLIMSGDVEQNPGPTIILSVGDLPTLTNILEGAASKWMSIGDQLRFTDGELRTIQSNPRCTTAGDQGSFRELLAQWLKWAPPKHELPTLEKLALALRSAGEERLAYDLPQKYQEKKENLTQASTSMSSSSPSSDEHSLPNVKVRNPSTCMYPEDTIEATTKRNVAMMRSKFANLLDYVAEKLKQKLEKKEFRIARFHLRLSSMFAPAECIPTSSDIDEIFTAITNNQLWDYLNYYQLETIIEKYGKDDKEMKQKMTEYKQDLAGFKATTKIVDWMQVHSEELQEDSDSGLATPPAKRKRLARYDPKYFRKLEMKLKEKFTDRTLEYVDDLWESVSDCCLLPRLTVLLDNIHRGCISISWLVQPHVVPQLIEKGRRCTEFFREHKIIRVVVDDECIYEKKSIIEAETPTMPVKNAKPIELSAVQKEVDVEKEAKESLQQQLVESAREQGVQKEVKEAKHESPQEQQSKLRAQEAEQELRKAQQQLQTVQGESGGLAIAVRRRDKQLHHQSERKRLQPDVDTEYSLILYYSKSIPYKRDGYAIFAVSLSHPLYLENLSKDIKEQFPGVQFWLFQKHRVQMTGDAVELKYPQAVGSWRIEPDRKPPRISQKDVDLPNYHPELSCSKEHYPPRMLLTITSPVVEAENAKCSLRVVGVSEHVEFLMQLKREKQPESSEMLQLSPHSSATLGERPTLRMLLAFPAREGMLNIPDMIGTSYTQFGIFLLEDDEGTKVEALENQYRDNAEKINIEILKEWIRGQGKQPVIWRTLVEVLHTIGLNVLADSIAIAKY